jgi:hypothetical protein
MKNFFGHTIFNVFNIRVTWGGGGEANAPPIFFLPMTSQSRMGAFGVKMGESVVCILRTGSNISSPSF